uniref:Uncharacterized protein n=1 Tax=viral metagenome TaxID=1070528 RepID=A0A6M3L4I8_9ZZZZ
MRVCINKSTGKLIESQSGGSTQEHLDTLKQNALNAGYSEEDIEVKYVTDAEFEAIMAETTAPTSEEILKKEQEAKIQAKIRDLAIKELKKEGELPADYKDKG